MARRWALTAIAALTLVWLLLPSAVPIYDGFGTDEPYRHVPRFGVG
jgi:hypothetical protein